MRIFQCRMDDELAKEFQIKIIQKYGKYRGKLNEAFTEAVRDWVEKEGEV